MGNSKLLLNLHKAVITICSAQSRWLPHKPDIDFVHEKKLL